MSKYVKVIKKSPHFNNVVFQVKQGMKATGDVLYAVNSWGSDNFSLMRAEDNVKVWLEQNGYEPVYKYNYTVSGWEEFVDYYQLIQKEVQYA